MSFHQYCPPAHSDVEDFDENSHKAKKKKNAFITGHVKTIFSCSNKNWFLPLQERDVRIQKQRRKCISRKQTTTKTSSLFRVQLSYPRWTIRRWCITCRGPDPLSDTARRSDQLQRETSGVDQWNHVFFDSIGSLLWSLFATERIARTESESGLRAQSHGDRWCLKESVMSVDHSCIHALQGMWQELPQARKELG